MDSILVVNAGSSSVKFEVFAVDGSKKLTRKIKGQIDGIGRRPRLRAHAAGRRLPILICGNQIADAALRQFAFVLCRLHGSMARA